MSARAALFDTSADWATVSVAAFWDRTVALEDWREGFLAGSLSYVPQTLKGIHPRQAIGLLGVPAFVDAWPRVRQVALARWPELARRIRKWDVFWSLAATGRLDIRPLQVWPGLARRTREFLLYIADHQGATAYAAAKALGMTYRRAHDHARKLVDLGFCMRREEPGPRRKVLLYATHEARGAKESSIPN